MHSSKNQAWDDKAVIFGHRHSQSRDVKWLCLDNIFQKLYRPNLYDIGGTYIDNVPDFWFTYKTEQCGSIFLLHLFASHHHEETFSLCVDTSSDIKIDKKNRKAYLAKSPTFFEKKQKKKSPNYLTTYNFSEFDVDTLKNLCLYIGVSLFVTKKLKNEKIIHDFGALLKDPVASDFTMESSDGTTFKVHKSILIVQSEVFKAMFRSDTVESQNNHVKLSDVDTSDLRGMLEFMYTGTISDINDCDFNNLLLKADQYHLPGLIELSKFVLQQNLTVENAIQTMAVADMANCEDLKLATLKFIKKNITLFDKNFIKEIGDHSMVAELFNFILPEP